MTNSYESYVEFLYNSPTQSHEICYHLGERMIGVTPGRRVLNAVLFALIP